MKTAPVSLSAEPFLPVFHGAEGYGISTPAGRGGQIIKVTNLNDSGPGSLRAALETPGPRTVVFEVSGTINLNRRIYIRNPYLTVAGQTAPSPGVTLANAYLLIKTHDVLVQHLRIRPGDTGPDNLQDRDALTIGYEPSVPVFNIVIDHCSLSWAIDENLDINRAENVTVSNCIISEALRDSFNIKGPHSKAVLINPHSNYITLLRNVVAHNSDRHPNIGGGANSVISVNNLWYDAGVRWTSFSNPYAVGPIVYTDIGNKYIDGPSTTLIWSGSLYYLHPSLAAGTKIYIEDSLYEGSGNYMKNGAASSCLVKVRPAWDESISVMPSREVESYVLENAGARPADRDAVDKRIVYEVMTRTGSIIDTPREVGGWPSLAENRRAFPLPANPSDDDDGDGYTNTEELLQQMAAEVEGRMGAQDIFQEPR